MTPGSYIIRAIHSAYARLDSQQLAGYFPARQSIDLGYVSEGQYRGKATALLNLVGNITPSVCLQAREKINEYVANEHVGRIVVRVDSPGGYATGVHELCLTIEGAAKVKPVLGYIEHVGASAGYYAVVSCTSLTCSPAAIVGSVGTYVAIVDASKALEQQGIQVLVIRAGKFKGSTEWGKLITSEEIDEIQRHVDSTNRLFLAAVSRGRKIIANRLADIADGRTFIGVEAQAAGLVDKVMLWEQFVAELNAQNSPQQPTPQPTNVQLYGPELAAKIEIIKRRAALRTGQATSTRPRPTKSYRHTIRQWR